MKKVPENKQRNSLYLTPNEINDGKKLLQKEKEEQAINQDKNTQNNYISTLEGVSHLIF